MVEKVTETNEIEALAADEKNPVMPDRDQLSPEEILTIEAMIEAGVLYGRKHSKTNPKMQKYIFGTRRGIEILDLTKTLESLDSAINFLQGLVEKNLPVLVVGVKPATKDLVENFAKSFDFPFVNERWLGGTLTNFKTITKRIDYLKKIQAERETGSLGKYTKKEQLLISRELQRMEKMFRGIDKIKDLPAALLVIDPTDHQTAIREANRLKIPVAALINSDGDPDQVQYPIPANDNARSSVMWVLDRIEKQLKDLKQSQSVQAAPAEIKSK